ncbi:glutamate-gated chloride channel subunit beta-like [Oppia nitens]|uniref:glutamate-gated chloride channel subunit beta-like n=1 Tax=Oppia nitens TaxID=1686743 RepID=UPI0023DA228C|nr:glutamate-gated chloride channel subunit beta-like [Oppia nitens]
MLSTDRYDYRFRPEAHTTVNVSLTLLAISSPSESSNSYDLELLLHQHWPDHRLQYEDRDGGGDGGGGQHHKYLNALLHSDKLWIPDLYFIRHGRLPSRKHLDDLLTLKIISDGTVYSTNRYDMQINCLADNIRFPFDTVKCRFAIESKYISNERQQLELVWDEPALVSSGSSINTDINGAGYLIGTTTSVCLSELNSLRDNYSCLDVELVFKRDISYYISVYYIPTLVLLSLIYLGFWLHTSSLAMITTGRIIINTGSLLALLTLFVWFRHTLPLSAELWTINLWQFVSMLYAFVGHIVLIVQWTVSRRDIDYTDTTDFDDDDDDNDDNIVGRQRLPSNGVPEEIEMKAPLCGRNSRSSAIEMTPIGGQHQQCNDESSSNDINHYHRQRGVDSSRPKTMSTKWSIGRRRRRWRQHRNSRWISNNLLDKCCKYLYPISYVMFLVYYFIVNH